jgi:divalent metal cation (Fe/Co/Zn/Cd) transporter
MMFRVPAFCPAKPGRIVTAGPARLRRFRGLARNGDGQRQAYTCPVAEPLVETTALPLALRHSAQRERLERRARLLARGGIAYHFLEFAIALGAGLAAGSIALIGFGADSLIEAFAGFVVLWLYTGARNRSVASERRAQQLIAASFFVLAAYIGVESVRTLVGGHHPETSWIGVGLAAFTAVTMPLLARAKRQVGHQLRSSATVKEASQTQLCAYLSVALLAGLLLNAVAGLWWADPAAAIVISLVAVREGRESWRGEGCECC